MAGPVNLETLRTRIESFMHGVLLETGAQVFVPEQFVHANCGSEDQVLRVLAAMEVYGDLEGFATLQCAAGHSYWSGPPEELRKRAPRRCIFEGCETHELTAEERASGWSEPRVIVRYTLAPRMLEALSQKKNPKAWSHQA